MTDHRIQVSCHLLKELEKEIKVMRELMRRVEVSSHNMNGTWIAISVTQKNWKKDFKEDLIDEGFKDEKIHP